MIHATFRNINRLFAQLFKIGEKVPASNIFPTSNK